MARNSLLELVERIGELERRQSNFVRRVRVTKNEGSGMVRVTDGAGFDPEPVPQASMSAGNWKLDAPADEGTAGILISPEGDPSQAVFYPSDAWDDHPHASTDPKRARLVGPGGESITIEGGRVTIDMPEGATINTRIAVINSDDIRLGGSGGRRVARIDDRVHVKTGSSSGMWPIVEGSSVVTAVD